MLNGKDWPMNVCICSAQTKQANLFMKASTSALNPSAKMKKATTNSWANMAKLMTAQSVKDNVHLKPKFHSTCFTVKSPNVWFYVSEPAVSQIRGSHSTLQYNVIAKSCHYLRIVAATRLCLA